MLDYTKQPHFRPGWHLRIPHAMNNRRQQDVQYTKPSMRRWLGNKGKNP